MVAFQVDEVRRGVDVDDLLGWSGAVWTWRDALRRECH